MNLHIKQGNAALESGDRHAAVVEFLLALFDDSDPAVQRIAKNRLYEIYGGAKPHFQRAKITSPSARRDRLRRYLDVSFEGRDGLSWAADLTCGWDPKRHRFHEVAILEWRGDWRLRCELTVTDTFQELSEFSEGLMPVGITINTPPDGIEMEVSLGKLSLQTRRYLSGIEWFENIKKAGFCVRAQIQSGVRRLPRFEVKAVATFQPPPKMHVPDVRVWNTIGPSAGLPSLGKRR